MPPAITGTRCALTDRFWWPSLEQEVNHLPVPAATDHRGSHPTHSFSPRTLKYADTMLMPHVGGFHYVAQAHCSLAAWPEWHALHAEASVLSSLRKCFVTGELLTKFSPTTAHPMTPPWTGSQTDTVSDTPALLLQVQLPRE